MKILARLHKNPDWTDRSFEHINAGTLRLRLLNPADAESFGEFLDGLGPQSRNMFGPHPLNSDEAAGLCASMDDADVIRLVLETSGNRIIGYFIVFPAVNSGTIKRFADAGIPLSEETDCTFAPCLADDFQGMGIATLAMKYIIEIMQNLGFKRMVLSGGTQALNAKGRAFYAKVGFKTVKMFVTHSDTRGRIENYDMILDLSSASTTK